MRFYRIKKKKKTTDSGSRVFDRLFKVLDNAKQYKISCLGTGIFKPFSKNVVVKIERGTDAIFEAQKLIIRELVKNGIKDFRGTKNGLISGDGKSKMEFKNLDNLRTTPLWSVVFKSPLNHTKSGLIVSPIRAETKADAIRIFYKEQPQLKGKGEIVSVTQGTPPSVKRIDLVQKRPKIGDEVKRIYTFVLLMKYPNTIKNSTIEFKAKDIKEARQFLKNHFNRIDGYKITKFTSDKLYLKGEAGAFIDITYSVVKK